MIRQLKIEDITEDIFVYPETFDESFLAFNLKIEKFPQGCFCCEIEGRPVGYGISHPWREDLGIVKLNDEKFTVPKDPDIYYIHDIAVIRDFRGKGIGSNLMTKCIETGKNLDFNKFKLVSVLNSHFLWQKFGFKIKEKIIYGQTDAYIMEYFL
jgi:ribosomal protein S18 acetylase RimI-like enzyme